MARRPRKQRKDFSSYGPSYEPPDISLACNNCPPLAEIPHYKRRNSTYTLGGVSHYDRERYGENHRLALVIETDDARVHANVAGPPGDAVRYEEWMAMAEKRLRECPLRGLSQEEIQTRLGDAACRSAYCPGGLQAYK